MEEFKMDIEKLKQLGGTEWIKDEHHRIYFNTDAIVKIINLELTFYNTGNISSARLDGEQISNSKANQLLQKINGKLWYDIYKEKWSKKDIDTDEAKKIKRAIEDKLEVTTND